MLSNKSNNKIIILNDINAFKYMFFDLIMIKSKFPCSFYSNTSNVQYPLRIFLYTAERGFKK